jgi:hypothetical protein
MQENPSRFVFISFYFLLLVLPNRGFSKGYGRKNKKIQPSFRSLQKCARRAADRPNRAPVDFANGKPIA